MKRFFSILAIVAMIAGLSSACSKLNDLEKRVGDIEATALVDINTSIIALEEVQETLDERVTVLEEAGYAGQLEQLKAKVAELGTQISGVKTYADALMAATKNWADIKFATLDSLAAANRTLAELKTTVAGLPDYDTMYAAIEGASEILSETISELGDRVAALENRIQAISIIPAYEDGSVEAIDSMLTVNFIVSPASALTSISKDSVKVLASAVKTKAGELYSVVPVSEAAIVDSTECVVRVKADLSSALAADPNKAAYVAVRLKNEASSYTTDFVKVYFKKTIPQHIN